MGSFFKDLFGGVDDSAQDYAKNKNNRATESIQAATKQGREDILAVWPESDRVRREGNQKAYDILMEVIGPSITAMKKGNVQAQNQLLAGLGQQHNAIMGNPIDYSQIRSVNLPANTAYKNQGGLPRIRPGAYPLAGGGE